jgi:general secretion pathway protein C
VTHFAAANTVVTAVAGGARAPAKHLRFGMALAPAPADKTSPAGTLVVVALVLVLAWQLAYWTWVFVAPAPVANVPEQDASVDFSAIARLFGAAAPSSAVRGTNLKLKGVVAPTPGVQASAIFSTGAGRDLAVFVNREVQPGLKLAEVHPDHVIITRAGVRERVDLEARRATAASGPAARTPGFRLNVARTGTNSFNLSRKELDDALRDPNQLNYLGALGTPAGGGVRMEQAPPGSLAQKLGLQPGDVIRKVNGQPIASQGDLARIYTQFNSLSLVQAEVQRGGNTLQLSYSIQP